MATEIINENLSTSSSVSSYHDAKHPCCTNNLKPRTGSKTHQQLTAVYRPSYDSWLRSFDLRPCWETHEDCFEIFIWHGYRPNPCSLSYCLKSAFYPSNETFNAWTHFIPFVLLTWRSFVILSNLQNPFEEITYPFWIQAFGTSAVLLASSIAHLFNCYSAIGQELCYCLDYGMIPVFGLTAVISNEHYLCSFRCFGFDGDSSSRVFLIAMFFVSVVASYITTFSRYPVCPMKYVTRYGPYAMCIVLGGLPCMLRYYALSYQNSKSFPVYCFLGGQNYSSSVQLTVLVFILAIGIVASRFPERWFAGTFDIVAHSHQWFHVFTAIGIYIQHRLAESALKEAIMLRDERLLDEQSLGISVWSTFVPLLLFLSLLPFLILRTAYRVGKIIEADRSKIS